MDIKQEDIDKLKELEEQKRQVEKEVTAMVSQAKAKHGQEELTIERDGEEVTVTQNDMWEELTDPYATDDGKSQAKKVLSEEHPELFEKMEEESQLAQTISKKFQDTFGFSFKRLSPSRFLLMTEKLVEHFLEEKKD